MALHGSSPGWVEMLSSVPTRLESESVRNKSCGHRISRDPSRVIHGLILSVFARRTKLPTNTSLKWVRGSRGSITLPLSGPDRTILDDSPDFS